jgi:acetyl esterase
VNPGLDPGLLQEMRMALDAPAGGPTATNPLLVQLRELMDRLVDLPPVPFEGTIDELTIPTRAGSVAARRYRPAVLGSGAAPGFVFFHGGGFAAGGLGSHDAVCRELATAAPACVIAVDYRLAPEHPYPAPVEDAIDAASWVSSGAADLGIDASRLGLAGDSAGGCLVAAVTLHAREHGSPTFACQLLVYPKLDFVGDHPSHHEPVGAFGITPEMAALFDACYLPDPQRRREPLASPLLAPDLSGLPPALVVAAARDTLRDEAEAYGSRLHKAGVPVATMRAVGLDHGFLNVTSMVPSARLFARSLYAAAGDLLREQEGTR